MGSVQRDFPNHYQTIQPHSVFYKALSTINRLVFTIANRTITNKVTMAQKESQAGNFTNLLITAIVYSMEYLNGIGSKRFYRLLIEFLKNFITNALPISKPPFFPHILPDSLRSFYLGASFGCFIDKLHSQHQSYSVTILICSRAVTNKYCWLGSVSVAGLLFSFSLVRFFILGPQHFVICCC